MRRLARWMLNALTVLLLLLCVGTVALWVSAARGRHFVARLSPPNGHTLSIRDLGQDHRAQLTCISAFRHANMTGVWAAGPDPRQLPPGYVPLGLAPTTRNQMGGRSWSMGVASHWQRSYPVTIDASLSFTALSYETVTARTLFVPYWIVTAAFGLVPLIWLTAYAVARLRRPVPSACPNCNYNLTGNVSGVCPECGTAIVKGST